MKESKGARGYDYNRGGWKKLKRGKMRATRLIETLSKIVVVERVKLRQLLRLSRRHKLKLVVDGWFGKTIVCTANFV